MICKYRTCLILFVSRFLDLELRQSSYFRATVLPSNRASSFVSRVVPPLKIPPFDSRNFLNPNGRRKISRGQGGDRSACWEIFREIRKIEPEWILPRSARFARWKLFAGKRSSAASSSRPLNIHQGTGLVDASMIYIHENSKTLGAAFCGCVTRNTGPRFRGEEARDLIPTIHASACHR